MTLAAVPKKRHAWLRLADRPIRGKFALWATVPLVAILALALS